MSLMGMGAILDSISRAKYMDRLLMSARVRPIRLKGTALGPGAAVDPNEGLEAFQCFFLCLECGYLCDGSESPCPGCGSSGWVDLRRTLDAENIRKMEQRDRHFVPLSVARWGYLMAVVLGLGVAALTAWSMDGHMSISLAAIIVSAGILGVFATALGCWLFPKMLVFLLYRRRPTFPLRWRLPLPLPPPRAMPATIMQGRAQATGALLEAPISRRPCLAYEVTVIFDALGDLRPPMWVLEEERSAPFILDGREVPADWVTLNLPPEPVGELTEASDRDVARFLRQRGLFFSEGNYRLFEAIAEPENTYRLELFTGKVARLSPARERAAAKSER